MKWTTSNVKNPNYAGNHEIYVGTHTGSFKKLLPSYEQNPFMQKNLQDISTLDKDSRITALEFGNAEQSEILIGRVKNIVQLHSLRTEQVDRTIVFKEGPIVGLARYDDQLVAGLSNGQIQRLSLDKKTNTTTDNDGFVFSSGDDMLRLRQCASARNLVATGGKGRQNNLKVFDLAADGKQLFTSKNLPNDFLQLEVPVMDSDVGFIDGPHTLATCSRYGYVRVYDTRKQRRPVQHFATEDQMSFATLIARGNYIYTGTTMGALKAFDIRRMKTFVHTYKGFTGGISDLHLDTSGKYLTSACLDRYVRVHHADSTALQYQCYVKSKATRVLIRDSMENPNASEDSEIAEQIEKIENEETQQNNKKQLKSSTEPVDVEYEDMFENMQTICETSEEVAQNVEDSSDEESEVNSAPAPLKLKANKRKATNVTTKPKKKKN